MVLLLPSSSGTPNLVKSFQHVALSIVVLGIGGYAAAQSGQHRRREELARRLELDIETLNPLTDGLPDDDRLRIRSRVVERIFARRDTRTSGSQDSGVMPADFNLLSRIFALLGRNPDLDSNG